jgi:hypothetical protein
MKAARGGDGRTRVMAIAAVAADVNLLQQEHVGVESAQGAYHCLQLVSTLDVPLHNTQGPATREQRFRAFAVLAKVNVHDLAGLWEGRVVAAELKQSPLRLLCIRSAAFRARVRQAVRVLSGGRRTILPKWIHTGRNQFNDLLDTPYLHGAFLGQCARWQNRAHHLQRDMGGPKNWHSSSNHSLNHHQAIDAPN